MGKMCSTVTGILVLVGGGTLFAFGMGWIKDVMLAHQIAGGLLTLTGLGILVHGLGICKCGEECCMPESGAKKSK